MLNCFTEDQEKKKEWLYSLFYERALLTQHMDELDPPQYNPDMLISESKGTSMNNFSICIS